MRSASAEIDPLFQEYGHLSTSFEIAGGFDIEHRTEEILLGLGFTSAIQ